ncbi:hypothetical protein HDF26_000444 [Pedobacter cryoconitis]|uniref:SusD-like starch-binding protein associating with outer membrane n=1 Tax=Pedobacter cryoconitis TaxID=188932 RepID=A0A7W8ZPD7_9SPHI|nr:SusD/RagB family nutrient-binding outer membrane lipoprotein [Pedobacter cryoconitis]MBB5637590.1 hypothetical protein [Pedobacter cryoconitis]MBB6270017.1 hypothetical protein [Pedobacter cryoconitis]
MKTLHIKFLSVLSITALTITTSCKKYLDVNTDPNNPTSVSAANRLVGAITTTNGASMWRGSREIAGLVQYGTTQLNTGTNRNAEQWRYTASYFFWQNAYVYTMPNCVDLINLGKSEENPHFTGAGKTLLALNLGMLTDQYGSIVVDDFYNGVSGINLVPSFNDQQTVYQRIQTLLDEAIVAFDGTNKTAALNSKNGDIMYQGDVNKWKRFAYALKARYLNHLTKKTSLYNPAKVIEACENAFNADGMDAQFDYIAGALQTDENPWSSWGGFTSTTDPRYFTWSQFFVNMLTSFPVTNSLYQDPRISKIMLPAASDGKYRGLRSGGALAGGQGILADGSNGDPTKTEVTDYGAFSKSGYYTNKTSAFPFITYSEVKLIEAEAKLRSGNVAGSLADYEQGVKANMRKLGVTVADINNYWTAQLNDGIASHFANMTQGLSHIFRQKYITQCLNNETWVDMRRMDYSKDIYGPSLKKPLNINTTIFSSNDSDPWIQAMVYETNEATRNPKNVGDNSEKTRLLTPVWWNQQ